MVVRLLNTEDVPDVCVELLRAMDARFDRWTDGAFAAALGCIEGTWPRELLIYACPILIHRGGDRADSLLTKLRYWAQDSDGMRIVVTFFEECAKLNSRESRALLEAAASVPEVSGAAREWLLKIGR